MIENQGETFYDRMSSAQLAQLDEGIAQEKNGETVPAKDVFDRLAKRFGFSNA